VHDRYSFAPAAQEPIKKEWVVQKLPIKGGTVLRSAMLIEMYVHKIEWVQTEGTVIS